MKYFDPKTKEFFMDEPYEDLDVKFDHKSMDDFEQMNIFMKSIKKICEKYPQCEGCKRNLDHLGCYFRYHSPREWDISN